MSMNDLHERLRDVLRRREASYLDLLQRMVAINSFTRNHDGIEALGDLTAEAFAALGFRSERIPARDHRYGRHLVLSREAAGPSAPRIGLVSHLDTVFTPEEELLNDFIWREEGDRIYGPGTVDIKGGTVVVHMILEALRAVAPEAYDSVTWVVLLSSAEERGAKDFGSLCRNRLADGNTLGALTFEGGGIEDDRCDIVVSRRGMAVYRFTAEGRDAHAGSAHRHGANAVVQIADVIRRLADMTDYERGLTVSVGTVRGGTVTNRVPSTAAAEVEMRAFDADVYKQTMNEVEALDGYSSVASAEDGHPCTVRLDVINRMDPWPPNEATEGLFEVFRQAAAAVGLEAVREARGGLSDANQFWAHVPTVDGLGPAGGNAHCCKVAADGTRRQEYAIRSSFVPKALLTAMAVLRLVEEGLPE